MKRREFFGSPLGMVAASALPPQGNSVWPFLCWTERPD